MVKHVILWTLKNEYSKEEKEAANKKAAETYFAAGADYVVQDIRGVLELVSC